MDDDFSNSVDGSGYVQSYEFTNTPADIIANMIDLFDNTEFFRQTSLKVTVISLSFYVPSHDMLVSILMEVRFDKSGSVRNRSFEVLPFQIFTAGSSTNDHVTRRANLVLAFLIIRILCCLYTFTIVCIKLMYRKVIGEVAGSIIRDLF